MLRHDPVSVHGTITLTGDGLTVDDVCAVARERAPVEIAADALRRVREARDVVDRVLASGQEVYGVNTGLGSLSRHRIPIEEIRAFAFATVADQTSSYGRPVETDVVRAMMLTRANGMAKAGVGVRRELVELLVAALNAGVHPIVRMVGSVGQGDLSEMADIGKVLIGRGYAEYQGETMPGAAALKRAGLAPIELEAKEALALISSNGLTMGRGSLVLVDTADLIESFQIAAALSFEAFLANLSVVHPAAARMRPHAGHVTAQERLRELLAGSHLWTSGAARNLQDPLSIRCVPQTHGALYDALSVARGTMEIELNSAERQSAGRDRGRRDRLRRQLRRRRAGDGVRLPPPGAGARRAGRQRARAEAALAALQRPADRPRAARRPDGRPEAARALVRGAGRRDALPCQPGLARLPRPARRGDRGPRRAWRRSPSPRPRGWSA